MKFSELTTSSNCHHLYQRYLKIVSNPKKTDEIDSKQICKEIVAYYNEDYHHVLAVLSLDEINFLKRINNKANYQDLDIINSLINKCLLIKDKQDHNYLIIPDDLKDIVTLALNHVDINKTKQLDQINQLLIGLLALHGAIKQSTWIGLYHRYDDSLSTLDLLNHIHDNRYLRWHYFIYDKQEELIYGYEPYAVYLDKIVANRINIEPMEFTYSREEIDLIARYGMNIKHPCINCLFQELKKIDSYLIQEMLKDFIIQACQTNSHTKEVINLIYQLQFDTDIDLTYLIEPIKEAMYYIHSASFYGLSLNDYYSLLHQNSSFTKQESMLFYRLYLSLLEYTNQKFQISPISIYNLEEIDQVDLNHIRILLFENPEIIDQYIQDNPIHLNQSQLDIIKEFKKGFIDEFLIIENTDDYTIISNKSDVYAVYGIVNHLKEIYPNQSLPQVVNLALLPFKNKIVFDGILASQDNLPITSQITKFDFDDIIFQLKPQIIN